jgi:predicted nucleic acid-binding protein
MYVLDASFIISAVLATQPLHNESKNFLDKIKRDNLLVFESEIVLPEIASALTRITNQHEEAIQFRREFRNIPNFYFISIDSYLSNIAVGYSAKLKLKGADSIYVALAYERGATLVTLDKQQYNKAKDFINVIYLGR